MDYCAFGGLAQIITGIRELCQGNTFAGTAFTVYGLFWWSFRNLQRSRTDFK